jgi:integrase
MPTIRLTRKTIAAIAASDRPTTYYDSDLKGFGLKVLPSGARSWVVEYRPGAGGRGVAKKRVVLANAAVLNPDEARDRARSMLAAVRLGADPGAGRTTERDSKTVAEIADAFLRLHVALKRKPRTEAYYRQVITSHVLPAIGTKKAMAVTRTDVAKMHADVAASGRYAANRSVAILSAIYGWADGAGMVPAEFNPTRRLERFEERRRERFLTTAELERLGATLRIAETEGLPWVVDMAKSNSKHTPKNQQRTVLSAHVVAAVRLLMFTGARLREILNLEWGHVDLDRGLLLLPDSKTGAKTIVLAAPALAILQNLPRVGRYVIAGGTAGDEDEVPRTDIKNPWDSITRAADLKGLRLHDLRHTFASVGAGGGLGLPIIGALLGHADVKTTGRYAHLDASPMRIAADHIAAKIQTAMGDSK